MSLLAETCQTSHFSWVISAPIGFRAWGLGFRVRLQGLGFGVQGLGFRV